MQKNLAIEKYIEDLSSNKSVPGGGSAAALVGALATSLTSMVFNLTIGKKAYEELEKENKEIVDRTLEEALKYNDILLEFMDKDGEAFLSLMNAFKLPNSLEEEKNIRKAAIDKGYENALNTPLKLLEESLNFYPNIITACKYGNKNVISDAGVASYLLYACIESSILNVKINLNGVKEEKVKDEINNRCAEILSKALEYKNTAEKMVDKFLK